MVNPGAVPEPSEEVWEDVLRTQLITVQKWEPSSTSASVIIRSIETKYDFPPDKVPTTTIHLQKVESSGFVCFFHFRVFEGKPDAKHRRKHILARKLRDICGNRKNSLILAIFENCNSELIRHSHETGISISYQISDRGKLIFNFHLDTSHILESLDEVVPTTFNTRSRSVLQKILSKRVSDVSQEDDFDKRDDSDVAKFYKLFNSYKAKNDELIPPYAIRTDQLNCHLMPYQRDTVRWMCHRENESCVDRKSSWMTSTVLPTDSLVCYPLLGLICRKHPENEGELLKNMTLKGGILADEMGLGKTVQVLSLILTHRKNEPVVVVKGEDEMTTEENSVAPDHARISQKRYLEMEAAKSKRQETCYSVGASCSAVGTIQCSSCLQRCSASICGLKEDEDNANQIFTCPECVTESGTRTEIRTTLIVLPETLVRQWYTEINKHCSDRMKVMLYFGVEKHGYIQPGDLDKYDIILTTFKTLSADFSLSETTTRTKPTTRNGKKRERKRYVTSSLLHVKFWRLVVDEGQLMPSGLKSQVLKMMPSIQADNRWCVTGTPIVDSISDIETVLNCLNAFPFSNSYLVSQVTHPQYLKLAGGVKSNDVLPDNLLLETLASWMSRKTQVQVEKELAIPQLVQVEKKIRFSVVEDQLYKQEREKLRKKFEKRIETARNAEPLSDHFVKDDVVCGMKTLREITLTGQTNRPQNGRLSVEGHIYGAETAIFTFIHSKKSHVMVDLIKFLSEALPAAEVHRLNKNWGNVLEAYELIDELYAEVLEIEKYMETTIQPEQTAEWMGEVEDDDQSSKLSEMVQAVQEIFKKYQEEQEDEEPPSKKLKVEEELNEMERDAISEKNYTRRQAQLALRPIEMDARQQVRLALGRKVMQLTRQQTEPVWTVEKVAPAIVKFLEKEKKAVEVLQRELPVVRKGLGELSEKMGHFFGMMALQCNSSTDSSAVYDKNRRVSSNVVETILPLLPFPALYDGGTPSCSRDRPHIPEKCMGECSTWMVTCTPLVQHNTCLPLSKMIKKAAEHVRQVDEGRRRLCKKVEEMVAFFMKLCDPKSMFAVLESRIKSKRTEKLNRLTVMFLCQHHGEGKSDGEKVVLTNQDADKFCDICQLISYGKKLQFDAGFSSFHGHARQKSGVEEWVTLLATSVSSFNTSKFLTTCVRPYFGKLADAINVYINSVPIIFQLVKRIHDLYKGSYLLTDRRLLIGHRSPSEARMRPFRARFIELRVEEMNKLKERVRSQLGKLRYLINLMKNQLDGTKEDEDCPVCHSPPEAVMVFRCGHCICTDCFDRLKNLNRRNFMVTNPSAVDVVSCPVCRILTDSERVIIATSRPVKQEQLIPGVVLSSKMHCAIELMREIMAEDDLNKIVVFADTNEFSYVWSYLTKVFKLANIPFLPMCVVNGKEFAEFEMSEYKVLLCPLSISANGLNITGVNHVIYLDPPHLQSVLQQTIGMINRFGQKREVKVFHLCVEGTVDVVDREAGKNSQPTEGEREGWTIGQVRSMFDIHEIPTEVLNQRRQDIENVLNNMRRQNHQGV